MQHLPFASFSKLALRASFYLGFLGRQTNKPRGGEERPEQTFMTTISGGLFFTTALLHQRSARNFVFLS